MVQVCDLSFSCLYSEHGAWSCTDLAVTVSTCYFSAAEDKPVNGDWSYLFSSNRC